MAAYFAGRGDVRLAMLFGSRARGEARPGSDVDVAVQFEVDAGGQGLDHPRFAVAAALAGLCGRPVDVIDLAVAPPVLAFAVASEGRLLFERCAGLSVSFRARAYDRYCDTAPLRNVREQYLMREILGS